MESYNAIVSEIIYLTPTSKAIRFKTDRKINFLPGQFVGIIFNMNEKNGFKVNDGKSSVQKRAMSISSNPEKDYIEITVKLIPEPFVSDYAINFLEIGEEVILQGPYGVFYFDEEKSKQYNLLLAAGSGIAPIMSIMRFIEENKINKKTHLIFSNKTEEEIIWKDEIIDICKKHNKISYEFTLTKDQENKNWNGLTGRINKEMLVSYTTNKNVEDIDCYLCGPLDFVKGTREILLELGVPRQNVKIEIYG